MKQLTAKCPAEALHWIETHGHHCAAVIDEHEFKGLLLKGHSHMLRIPTAVWQKTRVRVGDQFDTRMYRATKYGRVLIRKWLAEQGK